MEIIFENNFSAVFSAFLASVQQPLYLGQTELTLFLLSIKV